MSDPYRYTPLDEKAQEIRLLTLLPGEPPERDETKPQISLKVVQLVEDNVPEFEALSYAWGSTENALEILVVNESGSQVLIVTRNLYNALKHLRHETRPRVLWIDAICIDQQNIPERSSQVRRMADIYTLSKRVVVWLGREADDSSLALDCIEALGGKIDYDWRRAIINVTSQDPSDQDLADKNEPLRYSPREWTAIVRLYTRSWFERLWIWQEIWLASPSSILVCGQRTLLWSTFRSAFACIFMKPVRNKVRPSTQHQNLVYDLCRETDHRRFPTLLRLTQWAKCSDPRDRIFAVQSLLFKDDPVSRVCPDYEKKVSELFIQTFLTYSKETQRLSLMSECDLAHHTFELPTWLPNWTTPQLKMFLTNVLASGSSAAVFERRENSILRVCGRSLETIDVIAHHKLSMSSDVAPGDEGYFGTTIHRIAHQFQVSDDQLESFCHALIAGFFDHHTYPQSKAPAMASSLAPAMELISKITKTPNIIIKDLSDSQKTYVIQAANMLENRAVYKTKGGKFGLAPNCTEPGDIVVALLGLGTAMILRGADDNTYKVVGESYCQGYMSCEGFLGQLPKTYRLVWVQSERAYGSWPVYYEVASGTLSIDDPRSGALPAGWSLKDHEEKQLYHLFVDEKSGDWGVEDPRLSPEVLSARGVDVQYFDLI